MNRMSSLHTIFKQACNAKALKTSHSSNFTKICCFCLSSHSQSSDGKKIAKQDAGPRRVDDFVAPSPFKNPGPRRYGYEPKYMTQGCLPRDGNAVRSLPDYRARDTWDKKSAMFGQNDYIDILGDGDVHPSDLLTGPPWLIAFKGNERERLLRKMEWHGHSARLLYPSEYNRMEKRIRYLTKLYNTRRYTRKKD